MRGALATELSSSAPDGERVYALCEYLHTWFKTLTANAALFMQKVNRLLAAPVLSDDAYALFKADTITYLSDFIADLDTLAGQIRARLDVLDQIGAARLRDALAAGEAASGQ